MCLSSVDFYDQPRRQTGEVGEIGADRHLTSELVTRDLAVAEAQPHETLGVGHVVSELAGSLGFW
jgi:hypothetical protein